MSGAPSIRASLQPDQDPSRWDAYAGAYETVFEPLTTAFLHPVLDRLGPLAGLDVLDVAAGAGGGALAAAARGATVLAVDGSPAMVRRMAARGVRAKTMDGTALALPDGSFDVAYSCFGVVLFPDPAAGMAEMRRVLRPGGRAAVVTWTDPHRYALAARLRDATIAVRGAPVPGELPAQLRFVDPDRLRALLDGAGLAAVGIVPLAADLHAPSAEELAGMLGFAPGMASMLDALGPDRAAVLERFVAALQADQGHGPVRLGAVAHAALAERRGA